MFTEQRKYLQYPIYHISDDGMWGISPNIMKIHYTQAGYGIDNIAIRKAFKENTIAPSDDGIYVTDLHTGSYRMLVSLQVLIEVAGLNSKSPAYGFHTKWSSDGTKVLCVIRTLEHAAQPLYRSVWDHLVRRKKPLVRVQHLFTVTSNFNMTTFSTCSSKRFSHMTNEIQYLTSWASQPFQFGSAVVTLRDGNHPNWVAGTHLVSMNLEAEDSSSTASSRSSRGRWSVVVLDSDRPPAISDHSCRRFAGLVPHVLPLTAWSHLADRFLRENNNTSSFLPWLLRLLSPGWVEVYPVGTGHPNFLPASGGRFLLLDSYAKERGLLEKAHGTDLLQKDKVPLKLIDVLRRQEVWLLQVIL